MKYRVNYEGFIIVEADSEEEALNKNDSLYVYYGVREYTDAEEVDD